MARVEKVLQGSISSCAEPYIKDYDNAKVKDCDNFYTERIVVGGVSNYSKESKLHPQRREVSIEDLGIQPLPLVLWNDCNCSNVGGA